MHIDCNVEYKGEEMERFRSVVKLVNALNAELNPICYLLALLAHHFLYVSRIMVKLFNP